MEVITEDSPREIVKHAYPYLKDACALYYGLTYMPPIGSNEWDRASSLFAVLWQEGLRISHLFVPKRSIFDVPDEHPDLNLWSAFGHRRVDMGKFIEYTDQHIAGRTFRLGKILDLDLQGMLVTIEQPTKPTSQQEANPDPKPIDKGREVVAYSATLQILKTIDITCRIVAGLFEKGFGGKITNGGVEKYILRNGEDEGLVRFIDGVYTRDSAEHFIKAYIAKKLDKYDENADKNRGIV